MEQRLRGGNAHRSQTKNLDGGNAHPAQVIERAAAPAGTQWRINLYRHDPAHKAFLGWSPCANGSAHTPAKFGHLIFGP